MASTYPKLTLPLDQIFLTFIYPYGQTPCAMLSDCLIAPSLPYLISLFHTPCAYPVAGGGGGGASSGWLIRVGATRLFFGTASSLSDSLVSLFPRTLPLTELGRLMIPDDMGVCGGVVHGRPLKDALAAATLGTLPKVGVGSFPPA